MENLLANIGSLINNFKGELGILIGLFIGHFLEKNRRAEELLIEMKHEVYSRLLAQLNTSFTLPTANFPTKVEELALFKSKIRLKVAEIISPARLIAGEKLEDKLREYFEAVTSWYECEPSDSEICKRKANQMNQLVIEIEELMRKEIRGRKKVRRLSIRNF